MTAIPTLIPALIPGSPAAGSTPPLPSSDPESIYDISLNGLGFFYANTGQDPMIRETAPFEKQRIDQASVAGEQTLTNWWLKAQDSFHGGAGQLQLEPAVPTPITHVRFDASKNCDVFTPGQVTRLPDTAVISTDTCQVMYGIVVSGDDAIVYLTSTGHVKVLQVLDGVVTTTPFTDTPVAGGVLSIATDGVSVYAATDASVYQLTTADFSTSTNLADYPGTATNVRVDWVKSRLMLGADGGIWGLDVTTTGVTLVAAGTDPYFLYQHPTVGWVWRCFAESPTAILAAGDAFGVSVITQFTVQDVAGAPTLQVNGQIGAMPIGERILSMLNVEGTFMGIGTTRGIRIGEFDSYFSRLTYGPLELLPTDPIIPCNVVLSRDRFVYSVGMAYDEGGLLAVDLGTKIDDAGRFAWSSHLIAPTSTVTQATAGCVLAASARLAFYVAGTGICLEQIGAGSGREAWLRTSRIRYDTTEPKLFKLGRVRGVLSSGEIAVTAITPLDTTVIGTYGPILVDPDEFRLPSDPVEWMQLLLTLDGSTTVLSNYGVKALPGTRKQRNYQLVLDVYDNEKSRSGQTVSQHLSARARLAAVEELDAASDEVLFQEFTPSGVVSTIVVVEKVTFVQTARVTKTSDLGGIATVLLRTVEG